GAERQRTLWGMLARASLWNKGFMHGDVVHAPRPHEQRIRRLAGFGFWTDDGLPLPNPVR
ncbi:MAG: hypothetical protein ABSE28_09600, partial [Candidatus Sulfotelmatobacter sp.]